MNTSLRRRHFLMWMVLGPLLLTGAMAAYMLAPSYPADRISLSAVSYPELMNSVVNENYVFNIRKNYSGAMMLEVMQISDASPITELVVLYDGGTSKRGARQRLLGMMGSSPVYSFSLQGVQSPFRVMVKDTIRNVVLASVEF